MKISLALIPILVTSLTCTVACSARSSDKAKQEKAQLVSGIWTFGNSEQLARLLTLPKKEKTAYCANFQPQNLTVEFQLFPSGRKYSAGIKSENPFRHTIHLNGTDLDVVISTRAGVTPDDIHWYLYFSKDVPTDPSKYDGVKENYASLDDCMAGLKEIDDYASEMEKEFKLFPPDKDYHTPPQQK
jgi:hypothetical protein